MASSQALYPSPLPEGHRLTHFAAPPFPTAKFCGGNPVISPLTPPLKRPKEGPRPFLWKPSWSGGFPKDGRGCFAPRNDNRKPLSFRGGPTGRRGNPFLPCEDEGPKRGACGHSGFPALRETRVLTAWQFWCGALSGHCPAAGFNGGIKVLKSTQILFKFWLTLKNCSAIMPGRGALPAPEAPWGKFTAAREEDPCRIRSW